MKRSKTRTWLAEAPSSCLGQKLRDLDAAYRNALPARCEPGSRGAWCSGAAPCRRLAPSSAPARRSTTPVTCRRNWQSSCSCTSASPANAEGMGRPGGTPVQRAGKDRAQPLGQGRRVRGPPRGASSRGPTVALPRLRGAARPRCQRGSPGRPERGRNPRETAPRRNSESANRAATVARLRNRRQCMGVRGPLREPIRVLIEHPPSCGLNLISLAQERTRLCLLCQAPFTEPRRVGRPRRYCYTCGPLMDALSRRKAARKFRARKRKKRKGSERDV